MVAGPDLTETITGIPDAEFETGGTILKEVPWVCVAMCAKAAIFWDAGLTLNDVVTVGAGL